MERRGKLKLKPEYNIFLIKPDGIQQKVLNEFGMLCQNERIEIMDTRYIKIEPSEVQWLFNTGNDSLEYGSYMGRDSVLVGICRGKNAFEKTRDIKYQIRKEHGVLECMENLLHTAEPGVEFERQFCRFFPDLDIRQFGLGCDLYTGRSWNFECLKELDQLSNLHTIGLCCNEVSARDMARNQWQDQFEFTILWYFHTSLYAEDRRIPILIYSLNLPLLKELSEEGIGIKELTQLKATDEILVATDYIPWKKEDRPAMIEAIRLYQQIGIDSLYLYDARIGYDVLNIMEYWGITKGTMGYVGGSARQKMLGSFTIPRDAKVKRLLAKYVRKENEEQDANRTF